MQSVQFRYIAGTEYPLATIVKTPSGTWKAVVRKQGWPTAAKTFRTKRDAEDWARRAEDEMVRGMYIQRSPSERMLFKFALDRYLADVTPTKKHFTQRAEVLKAKPLRNSSVCTRLLRSMRSSLPATETIAWLPTASESIRLQASPHCCALQLEVPAFCRQS